MAPVAQTPTTAGFARGESPSEVCVIWMNPGYWSSFVSDLRVYEVDVTKGFTAKGAISMKDVFQASNYYGWTYYWTPQARRSVMADDFVYSISDAGLRVANIADLSKPIATAFFDKYVEKY